MKESSGADYQSTAFARALCASDPKVGKTSYLTAAALGCLPWQKHGGIVDKPENLHIVTFDANALGGIKQFLMKSCGAPPEALKFRVYNMQDDASVTGTSDWDWTLYNQLMTVFSTIRSRARGVPCVIISSLTGVAAGLQRGLSGPPNLKARGAGMDMSKWAAFANQISEIRSAAQAGEWHLLWEAHLHKASVQGQGQEAEEAKETLQISGKSGGNFAYNVEQVFRIRRINGKKFPGTEVDETYLDCRPSLDFIAGGRAFTESLAPKEPDPTLAFKKLGLTVGHWNTKTAPVAKVAPRPVPKPVAQP